MEQYQHKVKATIRRTVIGIVIWATICILGYVFDAGDVLAPLDTASHWASMWRGFISGASFGILLLLSFWLVRNLQALKSEKALRKLYVKETDERSIQIWTSARAAASQTTLLLWLAAGVVAGYFSMTVSITIIACALLHSLICIGFKLFYSKKY